MGPISHKLLPRPLFVTRLSRVNTLLGMAALLSICALSGCSTKSNATAGQPESRTSSGLVCVGPTWDLGEVLVRGRAVEFDHTFVLENHSDSTVTLRDVRSDCGCLVAEGYSKTIEPGGNTEVSVTISVFGGPGGFHKTVLVREESKTNDAISLSVVGTRAVSDMLYSAPAVVNFGQMSQTESRTKELVVARFDGTAVNYVDWAPIDGPPEFSITEEPAILRQLNTSGESVERVVLRLQMDLRSHPVGPLRSKIAIKTDSIDKDSSELTVDIEGMVVGMESPWVRSVFVKRLGRGASVERPIITSQTVRTEITDAISVTYEGDDSIQVELVFRSNDEGDSKIPMVRVSRRKDVQAGGLVRGTLSLFTDGTESGPISKIDVSAFLPR